MSSSGQDSEKGPRGKMSLEAGIDGRTNGHTTSNEADTGHSPEGLLRQPPSKYHHRSTTREDGPQTRVTPRVTEDGGHRWGKPRLSSCQKKKDGEDQVQGRLKKEIGQDGAQSELRKAAGSRRTEVLLSQYPRRTRRGSVVPSQKRDPQLLHPYW